MALILLSHLPFTGSGQGLVPSNVTSHSRCITTGRRTRLEAGSSSARASTADRVPSTWALRLQADRRRSQPPVSLAAEPDSHKLQHRPASGRVVHEHLVRHITWPWAATQLLSWCQSQQQKAGVAPADQMLGGTKSSLPCTSRCMLDGDLHQVGHQRRSAYRLPASALSVNDRVPDAGKQAP